MPFGVHQSYSSNNSSRSATATSNNNNSSSSSILAQTLFDNDHSKSSSSPMQHQQQQQATAAASTSEALIVQSNSGVVSDEILLQLQEQVGEGKQIYVLNSEDDDANVQYLIVDKDTDISAILQDPSIFQQSSSTVNLNNEQNENHKNNHNNQYMIVQNNVLNVDHQLEITSHSSSSSSSSNHANHNGAAHSNLMPQHQHQHHSNKLNHKTSNSNINSNSYTTIQSLAAIEESIQRVNGPLPKRKNFEFQLENQKYSYQDAFLKFLAGEKQPSLDIISEQINRKPKDNYYMSVKAKGATLAGGPSTPITVSSSNGVTQQVSTVTSASNTAPTASYVDKENYYNASRRENLLPLNSYEYRNSYKDHYDHQGVRVNPAILKALPQDLQHTLNTQQATSSTAIRSTVQSANPQHKPASSLINDVSQLINYPQETATTENNIDLDLLAKESALMSAKAASIDHTYKIKQQQQVESQQKTSTRKRTKTNSSTADSSDGDTDEKSKKKFKKTNSSGQNTEDAGLPPAVTAIEAVVDKEEPQMTCAVDEPTFTPGEFLIHKSTFNDYENYDIWCVRDDGYLQKYEPVYLSTGERCHQSADVLAQYTPDKTEFIFVKVEEKGKTEQNNVVVCVLAEYEPKNNQNIQLVLQQTVENSDNPQQQQSDELIADNDKKEKLATAAGSSGVLTYDDLKPTFDIFLQILLSQFINSEFLFKIKELQDDYFKPALDLIDTVISEKFQMVNEQAKFNDNYRQALNEKPKISIESTSQNPNEENTKPEKCQAFLDIQDAEHSAEFIVKLHGSQYNTETLNPIEDGDFEKIFYTSSKASKLSEVYHSLKHLKIIFYDYCSQKIEQVKRELNESNAASDLLNHCLADSQWLVDLFEKFKKLLTDVDEYLTANSSLEASSIPAIDSDTVALPPSSEAATIMNVDVTQ